MKQREAHLKNAHMNNSQEYNDMMENVKAQDEQVAQLKSLHMQTIKENSTYNWMFDSLSKQKRKDLDRSIHLHD